MNPYAGILSIQKARADVESIRRALAQAVGSFLLKSVEEVAVSSSCMAGCGVDVVRLDGSFWQRPRGEILAILSRVHGAAPSSYCAAPEIRSLP
jgi:hypothetical protein